MCDTTHSSPTNEDEPSDCHVSHQKSPTFYQKSPDDLLVWHVSFVSFITDEWWWTSWLPRFCSKESYILSKQPYFHSKEPWWLICDTFHSYNSSLMNDDELSDSHISIRKSPTFYQKSTTFIQKSPCILSREACAWHVELSVCNIFRQKSPTFWQKSPTFCQKSHTIYQNRPVPDMLNFLIATRGKRACICGSFGCWCCSMLQWVAVYCSVLQCEGSLKHACICEFFGCSCCSVLQCVAVCCSVRAHWNVLASVSLLAVGVTACCSVVRCIAV